MTLKVFDLQCENIHVFEGWFRSHEDYDQQLKRGLLSCPLCDSTVIQKKLSAPRLNLRHGRGETAFSAPEAHPNAQTATQPDSQQMASLQAEMLQIIKNIIHQSDDVGDNFATEARKMHEGEAAERPIRGSATAEEYQELREEGIAVLPIPEILDDKKLN